MRVGTQGLKSGQHGVDYCLNHALEIEVRLGEAAADRYDAVSRRLKHRAE